MSHHPKSVRPLLEHLKRYVPRYRDIDENDELIQLPLIRKSAIIDSPASFISDQHPAEKLAILAVIASKPAIAHGEEVLKGGISLECTSGTSGEPILIFKSFVERCLLGTQIWSQRRKIDPSMKLDGIFHYIHQSPFAPHAKIPTDAKHEVASFLADLDNKGIRWLHTNPSLLRRQITSLDTRPEFKNIKFVEASGSWLSEKDRKLFNEHGLTCVRQYGSRELWAIGYSVEDSDFKTIPGVIVEIVDDSGKPITENRVRGRVVATSLTLRLMPFVRYVLGDLAEWTDYDAQIFRLHEERESNLLYSERGNTSGAELFRSILLELYQKLPALDITYIQVRQSTLRDFVLVINETAHSAPFITAFIDACKAISPFARISVKKLSQGEVEEMRNKKYALFSSADYLKTLKSELMQ